MVLLGYVRLIDANGVDPEQPLFVYAPDVPERAYKVLCNAEQTSVERNWLLWGRLPPNVGQGFVLQLRIIKGFMSQCTYDRC